MASTARRGANEEEAPQPPLAAPHHPHTRGTAPDQPKAANDAVTKRYGTGGKPPFVDLDFTQSPFIVIWEVTRACDLACVHCRAEAMPTRHPLEFTTEEGFALLDEMRRFGRPLLVLTGGDPMKRPDVYDFIEYGSKLGLRVTMTPSGTPLMTKEVIARCQEKGLTHLAVSLDGPTRETHDAFRRVDGSFDWTLNILRWARELNVSTQINTTVTRHNLNVFDALRDLIEPLGILLWSVFFLVPTGRGRAEDEVSAEDYERVFATLYELTKTASFDIKTTAAPHYRRYVVQQRAAERKAARLAGQADSQAPFLTGGIGFAMAGGLGGGISRAAKSVNDANGFVFISHTGDVYPSGFLPLSGGNVRRRSLVDIYRHSELFTTLRDYDQLKGKCGVCEFVSICGGSRARAYGMFGDYLESDPFCAYIPTPYQRLVERGEAEPAHDYFAQRLLARGHGNLVPLVPRAPAA
ncbi:MAG: TIGR04053 family radical SAM/SPASM domain-containing protein [Candidatus Tectomicrobia bacterium]|nr:TIGR04053 family radical SAM/SPASM domain-containing protein [Candidatus Tectomicrobia bacterium]